MGVLAFENILFGGTSGASPIAAGAAALVYKANPTLDREQLRTLMLLTTNPPRKDDPHADRLGQGVVNLPRAIVVARTLLENNLDVSQLTRSEAMDIANKGVRALSYAKVKNSGGSCEQYRENIQKLMMAALLEHPDLSVQKNELAAFYDAHGVHLSSHRLQQTPILDTDFITLAKAMWELSNNRILNAQALKYLFRAGQLTVSDIEKVILDPNADASHKRHGLKTFGRV